MPAVDAAALRKLMADLGDDPSVMKELVDTFLAEGPRLVADLEAALVAGDRRTLNRCAHSLKSTSATFGAHELSRHSRELEQASEKAVPPDATARVRSLVAEWERVRGELAAWAP